MGHRFWIRRLLAGLLTLLVVVAAPPSLLGAGRAADGQGPALGALQAKAGPLPITAQPFFADLQAISQQWAHAPLGQVVADSPRETLLHFYAVMARVATEQKLATSQLRPQPGLFWGPEARSHITTAENLFGLAVQALDASSFPESVREDMANEAAMQLKEVLDYVFNHSVEPLELPDSAALKAINSQRSQASQSWSLPDTAITLVQESESLDGNPGFVFSSGTVSQIGRMHSQIAAAPPGAQPFATPGFYDTYSRTPGFLVPPRWYLLLPAGLRSLLEISFHGQTLFQIAAALLCFLLYAALLLWILKGLLHSYRYWQQEEEPRLRYWHQDNLAWRRVLLVLPLLPATRLAKVIIDDHVNFTGIPLVVTTYLFFILYFISSSFLVFILFEALGRSFTETLVRLRGGGSELQLRRVSNLVMPVGRALGGLVALALIYRLLLVLGLPSGTLLAFSAVPGLAIGLGASKLLGNLFAGLSIQTDRPVRVGEFCRIGENHGFVSRIGLRSLELQTLDSRVTIPNSIADELTVINYSRSSPNARTESRQSLEVRMPIDERFSPEQLDDLLQLVRRGLSDDPAIQDPLVRLHRDGAEPLCLLCLAMVSLQTWPAYLEVREALLLRLQQWHDQVGLSTIRLGVSYDTTPEQLQLLPELIRGVVEHDSALRLQSCRLMSIEDFSYGIVFRLHGHQASLRAFKDALHGLNQRLLVALAREGIEIPFPTQLQLQREIGAAGG
jgi:MscS family membrane protein